MMIALHHVAMNVADPEAIADFYCTTSGFRRVEVENADGALWLGQANGLVALYPAEAGHEPTPRRVCDPGIGHFCIQAGDGDWLWTRLADQGARFIDRPVALGTGNVYAYGRDPAGNLIEIEGVPNPEADTPIWMAHIALVTPDIDRTRTFYEALTGNAAYRRGRFSNPLFSNVTGLDNVDVQASWILTAGLQIELWQYMSPPTPPAHPAGPWAPGYRHIGFAVDDLDSARARLTAIDIIGEPTSFAGTPALQLADPDGNAVLLFAPAKDSALNPTALADPDLVNRRVLATLRN